MADLVSQLDSPRSYLAAKFLTRRVLNVEAVARTLTPLWRTNHGFTIRDMNKNRLVFVFEDEADRERVLMGEPWAYDKHLIVLKRIEEEEAIEDVEFNRISFWVQIHGLPVRRMNPEVATTLVSPMGKVEKLADGETSVDGGQAMRVRVNMDITKPLSRGRKVRLEQGRETWIALKYERLPNYCYWCRLVFHSDKDCPSWLRNKENMRIEDQQFGPWLRASNERSWRKTEVKVEGIVRPKTQKYPNPPPSQATRPNATPPTYPSSSTPIPSPPPTQTQPIHQTTPPLPTLLHRNQPTPQPNQLQQSYTTPAPPPTTGITPAADEEGDVLNMEVEENPGFMIFSKENQINQADIFERNLREIDSAIGFCPQVTAGILPNPSGQPLKTTPHIPPQDSPSIPRGILADITNPMQPEPLYTTPQPRKKTWKKLAREAGVHACIPTEPLQGKRQSSSRDGVGLSEDGSKKLRGELNDFISAEAVVQPRREP